MRETIVITQDRFEELLDTETRVDVLLDTIRAEKFISIKEIFRILGYWRDAERIEEEEKQRRELFDVEGEEQK